MRNFTNIKIKKIYRVIFKIVIITVIKEKSKIFVISLSPQIYYEITCRVYSFENGVRYIVPIPDTKI